MPDLLAITTAVLPACGIVLAAWVLVRIGEAQSYTQAMQTQINNLLSAIARLDFAIPRDNFNGVIASINTRLASRSSVTRAAGGSSVAQTGSVASEAARPTDPVSGFLDQLNLCRQAGLDIEPDVRTWASELRNGVRTKSSGLAEKFRRNSVNILRALLHIADQDFDPSEKNKPLQAALDEMAAYAGLEFIAPQEDDFYDERLHQPFKSRSAQGKMRETVASVEIRGLRRARGGEVILKAKVILYS